MDAARAERFYRAHAAFYDATRWAFLPDRRRAVESLDVRPGDRVIDFACGTGLNIPHLLARRPRELIGVDCSEAMLRRAARKFPPGLRNPPGPVPASSLAAASVPIVSFHEGDVLDFAPAKRADRALCTYALSMVDDWRAAILNMKRALADDGRLVVLDFDLRDPRGALRAAAPALRWWLGLHGVEPAKPYAAFLREHFATVEEIVCRGGYDAIVVASGAGGSSRSTGPAGPSGRRTRA